MIPCTFKMRWSFTTIIFLHFSILNPISVYKIEFNRNTTGVIFLPYVLNTTHEFSVYSLEDIKTMLKVVSTRFSRVATIETSNADTLRHYKENVSYYKTYSAIYTAEAAAMLNREAALTNSSLTISVYVGILLRHDPEEMATEIKLAFESVRKSNQIYPGTVLGVILSVFDYNIAENVTIANFAVMQAQKMKNDAKLLGLEVGIKTYCDKYEDIQNTPENMQELLFYARKNILLQFDFIICLQYAENYYPLGITRTIDLVTETLVKLRDSMQSINTNFSLMVETCIYSFGTTRQHFKYQLDFWTMMDKWGAQNNIYVWFYQAFDNPWEIQLNGPKASYGWWKFKTDQSLTDVSAYEEKVDRLILPDAPSEPELTSTGKSTNIWMYIGSIIGPATSLIGIAILVFYANWSDTTRRNGILTKEEIEKFRNGIMKPNGNDVEMESNEQNVLNKPYDKSIEIIKDSLEICWSIILGSGEFGVVYKAHLIKSGSNERDVVALKMTKDECPKTALLSILSEIKILCYLGSHEHIVTIKGAYTAEIDRGVVYLATELCELGCLQNYLRKSAKPENLQEISLKEFPGYTDFPSNVDWADLARWSYEIACGMKYLAEKNVIHADLATRNVLLTTDKTAKITDFGLSRRLYEYTTYAKKQQEPLPWRWMAIEALKKLKFSTQSDVWSFGVTLWEIYSMGDIPYPGLSWNLEFVNNLESGLRMKIPCLASPEIFSLMSSCWENEPQSRPTFAQLRQSLSRIMENNTRIPDEQNIDMYYT